MGIEDEAHRIAESRRNVKKAAEAARRENEWRRAKIHPWNIALDKTGAQSASEFAKAASRMLSPTACMLFRGSPRPSQERIYSKGKSTSLRAWCLFPIGQHADNKETFIDVHELHLAVTSTGKLIKALGLVKKDSRTYTGFMGARLVVSLPVDHNNQYHGKTLAANTPILGGHVRYYDEQGAGPAAHIPTPTYSARTLREILLFNLVAIQEGVHPIQTGNWNGARFQRN